VKTKQRQTKQMNLDMEVASKILRNVETRLNHNVVPIESINDIDGTKVFDMAKLQEILTSI
jgi:hypothetical protein